jgi:hypothetical protein
VGAEAQGEPVEGLVHVLGPATGDHAPTVRPTGGGVRHGAGMGQRKSLSSWRSWPLPLAPTMRFAG